MERRPRLPDSKAHSAVLARLFAADSASSRILLPPACSAVRSTTPVSPGAVQQLTCIGAGDTDSGLECIRFEHVRRFRLAVPMDPRGSVFSSAAPNVTLFAKDYRRAEKHSLESAVEWADPGQPFTFQVDGTFSLNLNQQGVIDLNFNPVPRFTLPGEDSRPVYVQPASIVPATGAVSPRMRESLQSFSRVTTLASDLKSQSRQLSFRFRRRASAPI